MLFRSTKAEQVALKVGAKKRKALPKTKKSKTKSISSSSKEDPISSIGKEKEAKNLPSEGLENRGHHPKADERQTTQPEHKVQSSAQRNFPGEQSHENCGLQSCQQIIRASTGKNLSEAEMEAIALKLTDYDPEIGIPVKDLPKILESQGVGANTYGNTPENIQIGVDAGHGVISNHDAGVLWEDNEKGGYTHAVHVTGVVKDKAGAVTDYIINDTGTGQVGRRVPAKQFEDSLLPNSKDYPTILTDKPISYGGTDAAKARINANQPASEVDPVRSSTQTDGSVGGKTRKPAQVENQSATVPQLPEFKDVQLGKALGTGGNKDVYTVPGREDVVIAVLKKGKPVSDIDKEIGLLNALKEQGLPTVEVLGTTTHDGQPAMVMKRYAQGSKDIAKLVDKKIKIVGESKLLNEKSISDLKQIRFLLQSKKNKIDDLQFLIQKDGSIVINDPLNVFLGEDPSPNNIKTIDLLIESAQKSLKSK